MGIRKIAGMTKEQYYFFVLATQVWLDDFCMGMFSTWCLTSEIA
jgi:hypothetical protein